MSPDISIWRTTGKFSLGTVICNISRRVMNVQLQLYRNAFSFSDAKYMEGLTVSDFLVLGVKGDRIDREGHLNIMRRQITTGISYDDVSVRILGTVALLHGVVESFGSRKN